VNSALKLKSVLVWLIIGYVGYLAWNQPGFSGGDIGTFVGKTWGLAGDVLSKFGDFVSQLGDAGDSQTPATIGSPVTATIAPTVTTLPAAPLFTTTTLVP
jgi:hypothetical protein